MKRDDRDIDERADEAYDAWVQKIMDDETEARAEEAQRNDAKRTAVRISPELLSLQDARMAGAKAGYYGNGASLNPYQDFTPEHDAWENARAAALREQLRRSA